MQPRVHPDICNHPTTARCGSFSADGTGHEECAQCGHVFRDTRKKRRLDGSLTAAEAMGVALSIPMGRTTMGECQSVAPGVLRHLEAMGWELKPINRVPIEQQKPEPSEPRRPLRESIASAINRSSVENCSNTPDFILAAFLTQCLEAFERASNAREKWYGVRCYPGGVTRFTGPEGSRG
jgi:hypothetical protein